MPVFDRQLGGQSLTLHRTWLPPAPAHCTPTCLSLQRAVSFQTPLAALQMSTTVNRMEEGEAVVEKKEQLCKYCQVIQVHAARPYQIQ